MMIIGREGADIEDGSVISKKEAGGGGTAAAAAVSSSSSWSRLKDPRIVRVSRAFGGKDRHSKVCTVRGLRDRRVRLSVPTAIQLYDLQDRLGLNQPSKVVDWLLDAAKHEIDELPPLQMPPNSSSSSSGNFLTHHHHNFQPFMLASSNSHLHQPQLQRPMMKISNNTTNWDGDGDDDDNNHNSILRTKAKVEEEEEEDDDDHDDSATRESNLQEEEDNNNNNNNNNNRNSLSNNFFSSRNSSNGGLGLLNSISSSAHHQSQQQQQPTYSSMMRWDPSTLSLAQSHQAVTDDFHSNFNVLQQHQVLVYQPAAAGGIAAGHSYFPSHMNDQYQPKQINFQMLMSSSSTNSVDNSNSLTHAPNEGTPFHSTTNFLPTAQKDGRK